MDELLAQATRLLSNAQDITPELVGRVGVLLTTYVDLRLTQASAALWIGVISAAIVIGMAVWQYLDGDCNSEEVVLPLGIVLGLIAVTCTMVGVFTRINWQHAKIMVEADPIAWLILQGVL